MAAVNITISGMLYDKLNRTTQNVALIGEAFLTDLSVGGGPIIPPPNGGTKPPDPPLGIWPGPGDPDYPSDRPPGTRPPKPPDPTEPPVKWKTIWTPTEGWVVVGIITPEGPHPAPSSE